jgi:hypothetical protein
MIWCPACLTTVWGLRKKPPGPGAFTACSCKRLRCKSMTGTWVFKMSHSALSPVLTLHPSRGLIVTTSKAHPFRRDSDAPPEEQVADFVASSLVTSVLGS